jgi:hypothetical protein
MLDHSLLDDLVMRFQQAEHPRFINAHLTAKTNDVSKHDRRQLARFGL